jgi:thiamine-monophosphate kinase
VSGSVDSEGEFGLIARVVSRLPQTARILVGPGDDAAVIEAPDGRVVATTDLLVEGRHFRRDWSSAYDVGRRAAAANLADVVAMGAQPTALLVGLVAPADLSLDWVDGLTDGLRDEALRVDASVAGGDVTAGDTLTLAVTALGDLGGRVPVLRSGAIPGDVVVLVGRTGRAAAGLELLRAGHLDDPLADAHRRPIVDYAAGLALAEVATSMIDVSDGLTADLGHVAAGSEVRIELSADALPIDADVAAAAGLLGLDPFDWVAGGGDDHCFAATVPPDAAEGYLAIGMVFALLDDDQPAVVFIDRSGPKSLGHEHFRS